MAPSQEEDFDFASSMAKWSLEVERIKLLFADSLVGSFGSEKAREREVVYFLLAACRSLVAETLHSLGGGYGRAAARNIRTFYETVVAARYIHLHPEKGKAFLDTWNPQWAKIMQNVPAPVRDPMVNSEIASKVPKYGAGKFLSNKDLEWSNSHTLEMAKAAGSLAELHPFAFDQASGYVHPSGMYLMRIITKDPVSGELTVREKFNFEEQFALRFMHDLSLNAIDLRLKYVSNGDLDARLLVCIEDFKTIWGYPPHI